MRRPRRRREVGAGPRQHERPVSSTWPWSARARAAWAFCSTSSSVVPRDFSSARVEKIVRMTRGDRPIDGSSSMSRRGRLIEGAADGQHLLLPARQGAGGLGPALGQDGEQVVDHGHVGLHLAVVAAVGPEVEVLPDRHPVEQPPALGRVGHPQGDDLVRRQAVDALAVEAHLAGAGPLQARQRAQRGGLAGAVAADEGDHLAGVDVEADAPHRLDLPVGDVQVAHLEERRHQAVGSAEVGLDDPGVALDLGRRALDQLAALDEDGDPVAQAEDEPHVVLDDRDGDAPVADAADQVGGRPRLGRVHPRPRLVEEQDPGLAGQGPGDLQPALVAVGQVAGQGVALPPQPDERQQLVGLLARLPLLAAEPRAPADGRRQTPPGSGSAGRRARSRRRSCAGTGGCSGTCGPRRPW